MRGFYDEAPEVWFAGSPNAGYASRADFDEHALDYLPQHGYDDETRIEQFSSRVWNLLYNQTVKVEYNGGVKTTHSDGEILVKTVLEGTRVSILHRAELFRIGETPEKDLVNLDALDYLITSGRFRWFGDVGPRTLGYASSLVRQLTDESEVQQAA